VPAADDCFSSARGVRLRCVPVRVRLRAGTRGVVGRRVGVGVSGADKAAILEEAKEAEALLTADEAVDAGLYIKAMEKVIEKGASYLTSEVARLNGMVAAESVSPAKKTLFMKRINVLKAFSA
jgi:protein disulfide-isomerase A6